MQVCEISYPITEKSYQPIVIAIGYFDGVHLGHQQVIKRACLLAKKLHLPCGVMTFDPHPKEIINSDCKIDQITPVKAKLKHLGNLNVDVTYLVKFTKQFAEITPEQFIREFLLKLNVKGVVVGFDFTFGFKGLGDTDLLIEKGEQFFDVEVVSPLNHYEKKISSTRIRDNLLLGNLLEVSRLLGRNYSICGVVVHGDKRGRTIGFPTANLEMVEDYLQIKKGVYAVKVHYNKQTYTGVMNIGYKPTFNKSQTPTYEVYIIDFNQNIYDQVLEVELIDYIRSEKKFNTIEELKEQIKLDVKKAKESIINIMI